MSEYMLFDERYMDDPDRANCLSVEDSLKKAKQVVESNGYPAVIVGPGCEDGLYWMPAAMRGKP